MFAENEPQQILYFPADFLLEGFRRFFPWGVCAGSSIERKRQRAALTSTNSRLHCCHLRYS
jgi:hypothetical protein